MFGKARIVLGVLVLMLSACFLPEQNDPFERIPEEPLETIIGKLFPFSVSVATRATHRLEQDGKLVGYLASDIVQLKEFEGREIALDGVWRHEKMRQIFWAEAIRLKDLTIVPDPEEVLEPQWFTTKTFIFQYPGNWEVTTSPDGTAYFLEKSDPARQVFLTFKVEEYSPEAERIKPNILLNGFSGTKETSTETSGREREKTLFFSNLQNKKYTFSANYDIENFDRKKEVFDLINSFVEGVDAVERVLEEVQKNKAKAEAEKLLDLPVTQDSEIPEAVSEDSILEGASLETEKTEETVLEVPIPSGPETITDFLDPATIVKGEFVNLVDDRAYPYQSEYYGFSLKTPFGYWYRNFGPGYGTITEIGFADNAIDTAKDVKFYLRLIASEVPPTELQESIVKDRFTLTTARNKRSVFEISGPLQYRDAMFSVLQSIKQ